MTAARCPRRRDRVRDSFVIGTGGLRHRSITIEPQRRYIPRPAAAEITGASDSGRSWIRAQAKAERRTEALSAQERVLWSECPVEPKYSAKTPRPQREQAQRGNTRRQGASAPRVLGHSWRAGND